MQELGKYRGLMQTASNADAAVRNKFETNRRGIELLSMPEVGEIIKFLGISYLFFIKNGYYSHRTN